MGERGADNLPPRGIAAGFLAARLPWLLLLGQGLTLLVLCLTLDSLLIFPVDLDGYWATVREFERDDLKGILTNVRTFGYPLLLKLVSLVSPDLDGLPLTYMAIRVLGVLVFNSGLRRLGVRPWVAFIAATPLLYSNILLSRDVMVRVTQVLTDATGESLLILTVGLLLHVLGRPANLLAWFAFTLSLFITYQTRPAFQAMIVVLPIVGWVVLGMTTTRRDWQRLRLRVGGGLAAACLLPFLAWSTFRLFLVGHFGLVCFTGYQLCAIAGNFLTDDIVPDLAPEVRPYVQAVLDRRDEIRREEVATLFGEWRPSFDEKGQLIPSVIEDDLLYTLMAHDLFFTVSMEYLGADPATQNLTPWELSVRRERLQTAAALAIIKARPERYRQWVVATLLTLPQKLIWSNAVLSYLSIGLAVAVVLWHVSWVLRRITRGSVTTGPSGLDNTSWELHLLLAIGLGLAIPQGLLLAIIATTAWGTRYTDSPAVFLTAAAAVALVRISRRIGEHLGLVRGLPDDAVQPTG